MNTVALTGESIPKDVTLGDAVVSGCVNISGLLKVKVSKTFSNSTASRILNLVEEASESKSKSESFIRRFARVYTPIVVISALFLAFIPPFFAASYGDALSTWLYRALTFLIVSCPCALVISIPLSFFCGIGGAGHVGILIKGGNYMEALARAKNDCIRQDGYAYTRCIRGRSRSPERTFGTGTLASCSPCGAVFQPPHCGSTAQCPQGNVVRM